MNFGANKTPVEIIKEGASFGGTLFRDNYSGVNDKWYRKSLQNLISWEILIKSIIAQVVLIFVFINVEHR